MVETNTPVSFDLLKIKARSVTCIIKKYKKFATIQVVDDFSRTFAYADNTICYI